MVPMMMMIAYGTDGDDDDDNDVLCLFVFIVTPSCLLPGEEESRELEALISQRMSPPRALPEGDKLWKFVVSGKIHPFSFIDNEGNLVGFTQDMLMEGW